MGSDARDHILRQLGFVVASWREDPRADIELLTRFVHTRDERAFSTIVGRYSQLVWGTCRRILANRADAEDALQATFLRLARDAARIVNRQALASWLFHAARGCAIDLRRMIDRQRRIEERLAVVVERAGEVTAQTNLRMLLDDELAQLSERDRAVLILCCLEGRTYADVAIELGCSIAAVHRRLVRAQTHLRRRLTRHGPAAIGVLSGGTALLLGQDVSAAPPEILARTVEAGIDVARTGAIPVGRAGALAVSTIAHGPLKALVAVAALLVGGLLAGNFGNVGSIARPAPVPQEDLTATPEPKPHVNSRATLSGVVREPGGAAVPHATVAAMTRRPFGPGERGLRDEVLAVTTADADGRFNLRLADDFATWFVDRIVIVQASAPGLAPAAQPVRIQATSKNASVELHLTTASPLRGRLLDSTNQPVAGIQVEVVRIDEVVAEPVDGARRDPLPPGWPEPVITGTDGTFSLPAVGGSSNVWVRVNDPRFALDTFRVDRTSGPADFRLDEARSLAVEVRAADTDRPLPGARLTIITDRQKSHPYFCATEHGIVGPQTIPADIDAVADSRGAFRVSVARGDRVELLVHAPDDAGPYIGVRLQIEIGDDPTIRIVRLPRGQWVNGIVTDSANGKPLAGAAVHWGRENATKPEWRDDVLVGRDAIVRTNPDGAFRLAVLPGPCSIRVYGPTLEYPPVSARVPGTENSTLFAHAVTRIDVNDRGAVPPIRVALNAGKTISGRVEHPSGKIDAMFLVCSGRVSPVRPYAGLALPVREGAFAVPGCRPGFSTRAYFLDPVTRVGAVIDLSPDKPAPVATLKPCGRIRIRVMNPNGTPRPGQEVSVSLLLDRDCPMGNAADRVADPQPAEWFDAVNYLTRPKTNADGVAELPALIPGARYTVSIGSGARKVSLGTVMIESDKTIALPDAVLPLTAEPGATR